MSLVIYSPHAPHLLAPPRLDLFAGGCAAGAPPAAFRGGFFFGFLAGAAAAGLGGGGGGDAGSLAPRSKYP